MEDLVVGALVQWPAGPGSPLGVIIEVDMPRIRVQFDGDPEPKMFNGRAGVVDRVELGGMVERVSDGSIGLLQALAASDPPRWQLFVEGRQLIVAESDLRPYVLDDPYSKIVDGRLGSPRQFSLAVTARRYHLDNLANDLVSMGQARVSIKPHQVSVVHRVVTNYPHRFLLCDEVGLGKTVEAGMILKELRARGAARRTLIITPPNLLRQWQYELKSKFNESFSILNSDTVKFLRWSQGVKGNPFEAHDSVLASSQWISGAKWRKDATEAPWDMVIVDEAHHARIHGTGRSRRENNLYRVVRSLVSPKGFSNRAVLFLTATPMQLRAGELYSLVELLDPALFPTEEHFDRHRRDVPGLSKLVYDLTSEGFPIPGEDPEETIGKVAEWLDLDEGTTEERLGGGPESIAAICDDLSSRHLLSEVLVRNRKKIVGGFMPRQAHRWEVTLTAEEEQALDAVQEYVRRGYARADVKKDTAIGFVMVVFQKLMASSIRALRKSLDLRRQRLDLSATDETVARKKAVKMADLEGILEDDGYVDGLVELVSEGDAEEAEELRHLCDLLDAVPTDSKADALVAQLGALMELEPDAKVLLFTEFRETQEYLRERLDDIGWRVELFHGQMKTEAKDEAVELFRSADGPTILLSTEAGGEGRNFQFCHMLINYDLPWNPMRVEQRIGRVDRIGQDHTVQVFNFWIRGTVEERILDVLDRRINVFEETVGGLDPILGDAEKDLSRILRLGDEEREQALDKYERKIEGKLVAARAAEKKLRDFIMETKSYSKEIVSAITDVEPSMDTTDQATFVRRLLRDVRTHMTPNDDGTWELTFNEPFISDFPGHAKGALRKRVVAMDPTVRTDSEHVEYMAIGHPVVDDLVERVTDTSFAGSASGFTISRDEGEADLPAVSGWLIVHELATPGIGGVRELFPIFIDGSLVVHEGLGQRLLDRAAGSIRDERLEADQIPTDELEAVTDVASARALAHLATLEDQGRSESRRQVVREREKITGYFDYRDTAASDRLENSRRVLAGLEARDDAEALRILPVWRANVSRNERLVEELKIERQTQLSQLDSRVAAGGESELVAIARVVIR